MVLSVDERLAQRNQGESIEQRAKRIQQERVFAFGLDKTLQDERLKQFVNTPNLDESAKYRLANSLYFSQAYKVPFEQAYGNYDGIKRQLFSASESDAGVFKKIQWQSMSGKQQFESQNQYNFWKDFFKPANWKENWDGFVRTYNKMGVNMTKQLAGLIEADTDMSLALQKKLFGKDIGYARQLNDWSKGMREGVMQYARENPGEFINPVGDGFWDTTMQYVKNPEYVAYGVQEQLPLIAMSLVSGGVGGAVAKGVGAGAKAVSTAGWLGRVQGFAVPLFGDRYSELRSQGVLPMQAFPEALLTAQSEALLEEWTLGFNLKLFKGAGLGTRTSIARQASKWLLTKPWYAQAPIKAGAMYAQGFSEEYAQQVSDNFWAMTFRNVNKGLLDGAMEAGTSGAVLELAMGGMFSGAGKLFNPGYVSPEEQLAKIDLIRDFVNKAQIADNHKSELIAELDAVQKAAETGFFSSPSSEGAGQTSPTPLSQQTVTPIEQSPIDQPANIQTPQTIADDIKNTPRYGLQEVNGKYVVMDYETQKEMSGAMNQRDAVKEMNAFNQGKKEAPAERKAPLYPSEKVTLTTRQLFNLLYKGQEKAAIEADKARAKQILGTRKDLGRYANDALKGLDITKVQVKSLISALTNATTESEKTIALMNIHKIRYDAQRTNAITDLKKTVSYINRRVGKRMVEKGILPDYLEKIQGITELFTFKELSPQRQKRIESLKAYLEGVKANASGRYEVAYIESMIPKSLMQDIDKLTLKPVQQMGITELQQANDTLKMLLHLNDVKIGLLLNRQGNFVADLLESAMEESGALRPRNMVVDPKTNELVQDNTGPLNFVKKVANFFGGNKNFDPETLAEVISAGQHGAIWRVIAENVSQGREEQYTFEDVWKEITEKAFASGKVTHETLKDFSDLFFQWVQSPKVREKLGLKPAPRHTIKLAGQDRQLTMADMMSIYMHAQSFTFNLPAMLEQGVALRSGKTDIPLDGKVTIEEITNIVNIVEANEQAMAMVKMANELHALSKEHINQISMTLDGILKADEENYWHMDRYSTGGLAGRQLFRNSLLEEESRLQEREGSTRQVLIRDFFEVLLEDQMVISQYIGLAKPLRLIKNLMNYKPFRHQLIHVKGYKEELSMLDKLLERMEQKPKSVSGTDPIIRHALRGLTRAVLSNPGIFVGQYASAMLYFADTDFKYISAMKVKATKADVEKYTKFWHTAKRRIEGAVSNIEMKNLAETDIALRAYTGKTSGANMLGEGLRFFDTMAIIDAARIVEAEMADTKMGGKALEYWMNEGVDPSTLTKDSPEYQAAFVKRANYMVRRSQSMFETENRSILTSAETDLEYSLYQFRSSIDPMIRMMNRAIIDYRNGRSSLKSVYRTYGIVFSSLAAYEVMRLAFDKALMRSDDDEKDLLARIAGAPLKMMPIIGFPVQRAIEAIVNHESFRSPGLAPLPLQFGQDVVTAAGKIVNAAVYATSNERFKTGPRKGRLKSEAYFEEGIVDLLQLTAKYFGVPVHVIEDVLFGKTDPNKKEKTTVIIKD